MKPAPSKEPSRRSFFKVRNLTQLRVPVTNLERSVQWYQEALGLALAFQDGGRLAMLTPESADQAIVLTAGQGKAPTRSLSIGFRISGGTVAIEAWRLRFKKMGIPYSVRTRGDRVQGVFLTDPDGYTVELFCD